MIKHDWKKLEKRFYGPKQEPEEVLIPEFKFFTIEGEGNPNLPIFSEYIGVLYSLSYGVKMSPKKGMAPANYFDYTVYPLEGVWDLIDKSKYDPEKGIDKDNLRFKLMIRQPDFVEKEFAEQILELTKIKKPHVFLDKVVFEKITEGLCVQMLHLGSYDNESASFEGMEEFCIQQKLHRRSKIHREIYLSDARKTAPEKLKTILRFQVDAI